MNDHQKQLQQLSELSGRPELLLHVCCGVCSVYPLVYLRRYFKITIFFSNDNIYPYPEFMKRLDALETYLKVLNDPEIRLIIDGYDNEGWMKEFGHLKDEPEGGRRCKACYRWRMERAFRYASKHRYPYCTTVMSISNRKNALWLNEIGEQLQQQYPSVTYLHADLKKDDGITINERMNKQLNLYHQDYCGCLFSIRNDG
ncbi:MAG: epoxyqueuosine reductase QueH [Erysipelotrichaceae bacterium]|nr:epoxyqueuosine reductase QueH [Erysipelotrichaceae bacterium]